MNPRTRSIRSRIVLLLLAPMISLVALWTFAASLTLEDFLEHRAQGEANERVRPAVRAAVSALAAERRATAAFLGGPGDAPRQTMDVARARTDAAARAFRRATPDGPDGTRAPEAPQGPEASNGSGTPDGMGAALTGTLRAALRELDRLPAIRRAVDARGLEPSAAIESYGLPVEALHAFAGRRVPAGDDGLHRWDAGLVAGARAMDAIERQSALVAGAAARGGRLTGPERRSFTETVAAQRRLWAEQRARLEPAVHGRLLGPIFASSAYTELRGLEEGIAGADGEPEVDARRWDAAAQPLLASLGSAHRRGEGLLERRRDEAGRESLLWPGLVGGFGAAAVAVSLLISLRTGRGLARELAGVRASALEPARTRLLELEAPDARETAATGDEPGRDEATRDEATGDEASPDGGRTREILELADAFAAVRGDAERARAEQAGLREGVSRVLRDVARRNQSLLHRQLAMLAELEGRARPAGRDELARLERLTTRMRRHARSLVVLSGAAPEGGRPGPVPVPDALRAAVAEIEEPERVEVLTRSREGLAGAAAADVVHLLAELLENAASYSPPGSGVRMTAERVGGGFAIEIEDRGLGMAPAELDEINRRLSGPRESGPAETVPADGLTNGGLAGRGLTDGGTVESGLTDTGLTDTGRLGLPVVARLAARHGVRVSLRPSPYGGTTAIVLLPRDLLVPVERSEAAPPAVPPAALPAAPPAAPPAKVPPAAPRTPSRNRTAPQNDQEAPANGAPVTVARPAGNPWFDDVVESVPRAEAGGDVERGEDVPSLRPGVDQDTGADGSGPPREPAGTSAGSLRRHHRGSPAPRPCTKEAKPPPPAAGQGAAGGIARSPEEARSMMASIQQGWRRGRASDPGDEEAR
ncbi:nitrate- and nitrite sensing domain-containing protein [Actinomadura viridis]|uniref:sensor histidine kinase n=1 Tax=Actinomadura viridis TaxID=58110 RepID=UPI0036B50758